MTNLDLSMDLYPVLKLSITLNDMSNVRACVDEGLSQQPHLV